MTLFQEIFLRPFNLQLLCPLTLLEKWMTPNLENSPHFGDFDSITSTYLLDNWVPEANRW